MIKSSQENIYFLKIVSFLFLSLGLILFSAFRPLGFDKDSYAYFFDLHNLEYAQLTREYSFIIVAEFVNKYCGGEIFYLFLFYASISISLKLYLIFNYSNKIIFSILIYFFLFYFIQDMTQIRVGLSSALFLLASISLMREEKLKFSLFSLFSILFHYQAIVVVLLYFINKLNIKYCALLCFLSFVISMFLADFLKFYIVYILNALGLSVISNKIEFYYNSNTYDISSKFGLFQLFYIIILFLYIYLFYNKKKVSNDFDLFYIKLMFMTVSLYFILSFNTVFSLRTFEFLSTMLVFILPMIVRFFKQSYFMVLIFLFVIVYYYYSAIKINLNFNLYGF